MKQNGSNSMKHSQQIEISIDHGGSGPEQGIPSVTGDQLCFLYSEISINKHIFCSSYGKPKLINWH